MSAETIDIDTAIEDLESQFDPDSEIQNLTMLDILGVEIDATEKTDPNIATMTGYTDYESSSGDDY
jgi:hypothetical protein